MLPDPTERRMCQRGSVAKCASPFRGVSFQAAWDKLDPWHLHWGSLGEEIMAWRSTHPIAYNRAPFSVGGRGPAVFLEQPQKGKGPTHSVQ